MQYEVILMINTAKAHFCEDYVCNRELITIIYAVS